MVPGNLTKNFFYCDQDCDIENVTNGSNFSFKFLKYIDSACYLIGIHNHKSLTHILILLINTNSYFQENTEGIKKKLSLIISEKKIHSHVSEQQNRSVSIK